MLDSWFALEFLRRRRGYLDVLCRIYTAWLVVQWLFLYVNSAAESQGMFATSAGAVSRFVDGYLEVFVVQHFLLLILATPPLVAGAVADERAKGTLALLLTTRLTSWEIITGKLLGRLTDLGYLALVGLPLLAFMGGYGHVGLLPLLTLPAVTVCLVFALGAASLLASVRSVQTRDAVVRVYLWCALGFGSAWALAWGLDQVIPRLTPGTATYTWSIRLEAALNGLSPLYVLDTFWEGSDPATLTRRLLTSVLAWGALGVVFLGIAVLRLRPVSLRLLNETRRRLGKRRSRPPIGDEPVRWKEREVSGAAVLSGWPQLPRGFGVAGVLGATLTWSWISLQAADPATGFLAQGVGMLFLLSLMIGIRTSGTVTGERERQTWEAVLLTPLDTEEIIWGKFQGAAEAMIPYVLAYLIPALVLAAWAGGAAFLATACLGLVTLAGMYFMGAMGISWSVRLDRSWQSLLATLASGYAYGAGFVILMVIPILLLSCLSAFVLFALARAGIPAPDWILAVLVCVGGSLAVATLLVRRARTKILDAEHWLETERDRRAFGMVLARALRKHAEGFRGRPERAEEATR